MSICKFSLFQLKSIIHIYDTCDYNATFEGPFMLIGPNNAPLDDCLI
jgi:hypothetical protein